MATLDWRYHNPKRKEVIHTEEVKSAEVKVEAKMEKDIVEGILEDIKKYEETLYNAECALKDAEHELFEELSRRNLQDE